MNAVFFEGARIVVFGRPERKSNEAIQKISADILAHFAADPRHNNPLFLAISPINQPGITCVVPGIFLF